MHRPGTSSQSGGIATFEYTNHPIAWKKCHRIRHDAALMAREIVVDGTAEFAHRLDDAVGTMRLELTLLCIPPAAAKTVQTTGDGAVSIGPAITNHKCTVQPALEPHAIERIADDLVLVQSARILAGAIDCIHERIEMEMLTDGNRLVLRLAGGDREHIAACP